MPRHGQQKVRTGCLTCKRRKVKCDETHPDCRRCTSTGRNCDRYRTPPTGSYSWDEVLLRARHVPSIVLGAEFLDPPGLTYFTRVVASELAGPFKSQLWTYELPQATYSEPALRHAVLAVASLYQNFGHLRIGSSSKPSHSHEAISHYNSAIRHLTTPNNLSLETVLLACILFVCIEFLSSNTEAAVLHATHGMSLVGSTQPKSDILPVLRHLAIFPHFFSLVVPEMPTFDSGGWSTMDAVFTTLAQAQQSLDSLMYRSVRMLRTTDHHRNGTGPKLQPLESARLDQKTLEGDLEHWLAVFHTFRRDLKHREKHEFCLLLLEIRWLVTRTWTSTYLSPDELIYDAHHGSFSRILELAAQAKVQQGRAASARSKFSFEMGFAPLLYFVVLKCRCLTLRVNALALMEALSFSRESLWDYATMRAIGTKIIEKEHGIDALSSGTAVLTNSQSCQYPLPAESRRVRDSFMAEEAEEVLGTSEVKRLRKKITLLFKSETGTLQTVHDWITIG